MGLDLTLRADFKFWNKVIQSSEIFGNLQTTLCEPRNSNLCYVVEPKMLMLYSGLLIDGECLPAVQHRILTAKSRLLPNRYKRYACKSHPGPRIGHCARPTE